jgi:uncharacterized protein (DUF427 family)
MASSEGADRLVAAEWTGPDIELRLPVAPAGPRRPGETGLQCQNADDARASAGPCLTTSALVAQRIERRPPEPGAQVRVLPGALPGATDAGGTQTQRSNRTSSPTHTHRHFRGHLLSRAPCRPNGKIWDWAAVGLVMDAEKRGRIRVEPSRKRIRCYLASDLVVDTAHPLLVWELPYYPSYYVPIADVRATLIPTGTVEHSPSRGEADLYDVKTERGTAQAAARRYPNSPIEELRDVVHIRWEAMDEWLEEEEPVYTHPRDPYTRVDILASSRHVEVRVEGVTLAESRQPRILFETGLPPRYYMPLSDVRLELLTPSDTMTHCPYKGTATYWHLEVEGQRYEDFVWIYRAPLPESQKIAGLVAFYDEKIDLYLDGELQDRPHTHFS